MERLFTKQTWTKLNQETAGEWYPTCRICDEQIHIDTIYYTDNDCYVYHSNCLKNQLLYEAMCIKYQK